jgi:hypothetical protein
VLEIYAVLFTLLASWEMPAETEAFTWAESLAVRLFPCRVRGTKTSFSFQLLVKLSVDFVLSVLAAASTTVEACYLLARGARRLCRAVQSFTDG